MEYVDVVNENNNLIGTIEEKDVVHSKGLWHREVAVWIMNQNNEILLQKRAASKKQLPNKWGICAGHVTSGENADDAIIREVKEEIGIDVTNKDLEFLFINKISEKPNGSSNNNFAYVYFMKTDRKIGDFKIQLEELSEVKYISFNELEKIVENKDAETTFSEREYMPEVLDKLRDRILK